jgi:hypothetical protein
LAITPGDPSSHLVAPYARTVRSRVQQWMVEKHNENAPHPDGGDADAAAYLASAYSDIDGAVEEAINQTLDMPWTANDCPPMAEWVVENANPLDLLIAAAAKPEFFSPPPNVLEDPTTAAVAALLPAIQSARNAMRALSVRSFFFMGDKRYIDAWHDIRAGWQLGTHLGEGVTIVDKLVGVALRGVASADTLALLQCDDLPATLAQQILDDLSTIPPAVRMADAIDVAER